MSMVGLAESLSQPLKLTFYRLASSLRPRHRFHGVVTVTPAEPLYIDRSAPAADASDCEPSARGGMAQSRWRRGKVVRRTTLNQP